jgi:hypothetical protein
MKWLTHLLYVAKYKAPDNIAIISVILGDLYGTYAKSYVHEKGQTVCIVNIRLAKNKDEGR